MKFRVSPLIVPAAAAAYFTGNGMLFLYALAAMTAHECAHLTAALCIGLKPRLFEITPFGAHLELRTRMVDTAADEIILYAAGPLFNGAAAAVSAALGNSEMYGLNFALMAMNLIPAIPLDGGMILHRFLTDRMGAFAASRCERVITVATAAAFAVLFITGMRHGIMNASVLFIALFMIGSAVVSEPLYNRELALGVAKKGKKHCGVKIVAVDGNHGYAEAARHISPSYTLLAAVTNDGDLLEIIGENDIIARAVSG